MKIVITAKEALEKGIWEDLCKLKGYCVYCIKEGKMPSDEEIALTEQEAKELGLI